MIQLNQKQFDTLSDIIELNAKLKYHNELKPFLCPTMGIMRFRKKTELLEEELEDLIFNLERTGLGLKTQGTPKEIIQYLER